MRQTKATLQARIKELEDALRITNEVSINDEKQLRQLQDQIWQSKIEALELEEKRIEGVAKMSRSVRPEIEDDLMTVTKELMRMLTRRALDEVRRELGVARKDWILWWNEHSRDDTTT